MYLPQYSFNIQVGNVLYCNEYSCGDILQSNKPPPTPAVPVYQKYLVFLPEKL